MDRTTGVLCLHQSVKNIYKCVSYLKKNPVSAAMAWIRITLLLHIQEVPGLNLVSKTNYADWDLPWYSSVAPCKCVLSTSKLVTTASFNILSNLSFI
jgi:hypothetical protein